MQRVHFCSGAVFETGDAIADSVMGYARAVATMHKHAVLVLPIRLPPEERGTVTLLLNETSQLSAQSVTTTRAELVDDDFVQHLDDLTTALMAPPIWDEPTLDGASRPI